MIHILHHQKDEIINWINHVKSDNHENSIENEETYDFILSVNEPGAADIGSRTRLLIPGEEGDYREFIVDKTSERTAYMEKGVYSKGSFIDIKNLKYISPQVLDAQTIQTAAGMVLSGLKWEVGIVEYSGIRKWTIETHMDAYEALKAISTLFDCELRFRVTVDGDQITGRYVDFIKKQGLNRGKETVFGKDLIGITRKVYSDRIVTALHCIGPERQDGTRLEVTVEDDEAFQNWNWQGQHLTQLYFPESSDQDMTLERLTQLGETELKKRIAAAIEYEVEAASLEHIFGYEHEITRLGDSVKIKDEHFNPPMYLDSRVIFVDRSVFNKAKKSYKLGEVIEYKKEDVMKTWRELQALYATKVIKSPTAPPGKPNVIWIQTGVVPEIMYTWDGVEWVKVTPTEAIEVGAETPDGAQVKANTARDEAKAYTNQQLTNYVSNTTYQQDITEIQNQIDGNITSWFYSYDPTLSNAPANTWTTTDDKNTHLGDLFYNTSSGYAWRFALENGVYKWISVKDTDVTKALSDAAKI
ncbi:phage tail spike protein [Mesobacillus subterraneus]|uniref:phage tail spike protein n=1 Tax=Mesobacillus subterraneus TaxID=285983 RepID=UPI00273D1691|nr:phage tail spike protein [Mesobacillus subterraneus]WLR54282.1 phage tail spike protein [Mesobacillus subterraneus]